MQHHREHRPVSGVTIDSPSSVDLDDAIHVTRSDQIEGWRAWVTIALVGPVVGVGLHDDVEARRRAASRYFGKNAPHQPMLHPRMEKQLTLSQNQPRRSMTTEVHVAFDGTVHWDLTNVFLSEIQPPRLSYEDVPTILRAEDHPHHDNLSQAEALSKVLFECRRSNGAMVFYDLKHGWFTNEEGRIRKASSVSETIGHLIVQELMVVANQAFARFAIANEVPILFRVHTTRDENGRGGDVDRESLLRDLATSLLTDSDITAIIGRADHLLNRASYSATPGEHWGLNIDCYAHSTSPLRRYADLVSQRQMYAAIRGLPLFHSAEEMGQIADDINKTLLAQQELYSKFAAERAAKRAEEAVGRGPSAIAKLDNTSFERAVKTLARKDADCPQALREEIERRLRDGQLSLVSKMVILFDSPRSLPTWTELRRLIYGHLKMNPHESVSLISMMVVAKRWPAPTRVTNPKGLAHVGCTTFTFETETFMAKGDGSRKTTALQASDTTVIGQILGLEDRVAFEEKDVLKPIPVYVPQPVVFDRNKHSVEVLNQVQGKRKLPQPTYTFDSRGKTHRCTCTMEAVKGQVVVHKSDYCASKPDAKRAAADIMVRTLESMKVMV